MSRTKSQNIKNKNSNGAPLTFDLFVKSPVPGGVSPPLNNNPFDQGEVVIDGRRDRYGTTAG